jgi:hypothetical protein
MRRRKLFTLAAGASAVPARSRCSASGGRVRPRAPTEFVLASGFVVLTAGCSPSHLAPTPAPLSPTSTESRHEQADPRNPATRAVESRHSDDPIEEQWLTEIRAHPASQRNQFVQLDILMRILANVPEAQFGRELERLHRLPDEPSDFEWVLLQGSVATLADRGDDETLTGVLASKCPRYWGPRRVECRIDRGHLANPVTVLTNAARLTTAGENRQVLVEILAEAFHSIAVRFRIPELSRARPPATEPNPARTAEGNISKELDSFLTECERWYAENRSRLQQNPEYDSNDSAAFTKQRVDLYLIR